MKPLADGVGRSVKTDKGAAHGGLIIIVIVVCSRCRRRATIRVIPQARAGVVERLGRYSRTLEPGLTLVTPFIDRVKPLVDLREQVVNFSPQSVITEDNVVVGDRDGALLHDHRPALCDV